MRPLRSSVATWFETHGVAVLLTMRVSDLVGVSDLIVRRRQTVRASEADEGPRRLEG